MNAQRFRRITYAWLVGALLVSACARAPQPVPSVVPPVPSAALEPVIAVPGLALVGLDELIAPAPAPLPASAPELALEMAELRAVRASLTDEQRAAIARWESGAVVRWNTLARELVAQVSYDPLTASRVYALLSLAQYDALRAAAYSQTLYGRQLPGEAEGGVAPLTVNPAPAAYPSEHAALAGAAAAVLQYFFPLQTARVDALRIEQQESRLWAGVNCRSDLVAGEALGRAIATALIARSNAALAQIRWDGLIPEGEGLWYPDPVQYAPPAMPQWGQLQPWLMSRPDQFRLPPPPAFGSPEFEAALQEVRQISDTRTEAQLATARFWGDGARTATPPGHWNQIAADELAARGVSDLEAARVLAFLNMALMDAGIGAWDTKYTYWLIRPFNADPAITTPVGRPNHPSYPSGHATFSGAAAEFLGAVFPELSETYRALAKEASVSRVYGGIHYSFDGERGLELGRQIGQLAIAPYQAEAGAP